MRNIIRIGAGTDGRNRFVAIALGVALAVGPAAMMPAAALAAPATDAAAASTTAGATITLQGADGASLAGHTFDVYRIGTYTDQVLDGTRISSLGVRGDTASNAWAADAIGIANAYDPDTADDIAKVYGYDDAGNIANIKMDSQTRQLRNISNELIDRMMAVLKMKSDKDTETKRFKFAVIGAVAVLGCFLTGAVLAALGGSSQISTGEDDDPSEE